MVKRKIAANRIMTPDGTILQSYHVHDYVTYTDKNGKEYMVDGGNEYRRRNLHDDAPYIEMSVYFDDPFEQVREVLCWGTYGKNGDQPRQWVPLCKMSDAHINAILNTQKHISPELYKLFETELEWRQNGQAQSIVD